MSDLKMRLVALLTSETSLGEHRVHALSEGILKIVAERVSTDVSAAMSMRCSTYLDEIDAVTAAEEFLRTVVPDGRRFYSTDDGSGPMPRIKFAAVFDHCDRIKAACLFTRDLFNRTQLTKGLIYPERRPSEQSADSATRTIHYLRCQPEPFAGLKSGMKRHETRTDDRNIQTGDLVVLQEWDPAFESYTGEEMMFSVGTITRAGAWGLPPGMCVFTLLDPADTL